MKKDFNKINRFKIANRYKCELCGTTYGDDMNCETCDASEQIPCNDAISRAAAMKICKAHGHDNSAYYIGKLPSARPILEEEPCDDCVSRKAVLNTLSRMDSVLDEDRTVESYKEMLMACYNDLPSVTPVPKKGKWIYSGSYDEEGMLYCSCCKHKIDASECYFKYCPSCGAKMKEDEKGGNV